VVDIESVIIESVYYLDRIFTVWFYKNLYYKEMYNERSYEFLSFKYLLSILQVIGVTYSFILMADGSTGSKHFYC